jgi:hypothetical protein
MANGLGLPPTLMSTQSIFKKNIPFLTLEHHSQRAVIVHQETYLDLTLPLKGIQGEGIECEESVPLYMKVWGMYKTFRSPVKLGHL